ncbi:hypothetical protein GE09DRAFT_1295662 [Coniochaeta sp. 2T2.1]|nr:hypothetical protein GE09DRAFT_1295662 [Coniochaeta sp. 2T2.1]
MLRVPASTTIGSAIVYCVVVARSIQSSAAGPKERQWSSPFEPYTGQKPTTLQLGYTRDTHQDGVTPIKIKALGVWDTVGTLGIPPAPVIGIRGSADQWRFTNTQISDRVENAFQALALDEPRYAFRPALWERIDGNQTNLKQVWFPGSHSNVGGSWPDQQIATISLAWMCDQLSTAGVGFSHKRLTAVFTAGLRYSATHPFPSVPEPLSPSGLLSFFRRTPPPLPWARPEVYHHTPPLTAPVRDEHPCDGTDRHPDASQTQLWDNARPWGLGQIPRPTSAVQLFAGTTVRRPGLGVRVDPDTNEPLDEPLLRTSERIHSSVRVRLACRGLGLDDGQTWGCDGLLRGEGGVGPLWRLERGSGFSHQRTRCLKAGAAEGTILKHRNDVSLDNVCKFVPEWNLYDLAENGPDFLLDILKQLGYLKVDGWLGILLFLLSVVSARLSLNIPCRAVVEVVGTIHLV